MIRALFFIACTIWYAPVAAQKLGWQWAAVGYDYWHSFVWDVASDNHSNTFIAGVFNISGNDISDSNKLIMQGQTHIGYGGPEAFFGKLDAIGQVSWFKTVGGQRYDVANAIAVDYQGNVYVGGRYENSATFDDTIYKSSNGLWDM